MYDDRVLDRLPHTMDVCVVTALVAVL